MKGRRRLRYLYEAGSFVNWPYRLPSFLLVMAFSRIIALLLAASLLSGCSLVRWIWPKKKKPAASGVVSVRLNSKPPKGKRITYAAAYSLDKKGRRDLASLRPVNSDGSTAFALPMDRSYDIDIFTDLNRNQQFDAGEPLARVQAVAPSSPQEPGSPCWVMQFGRLGPVQIERQGPQQGTPAGAAEQPQIKVPAEFQPYLDQVPQWLRDKVLQ